MFLKNISLLVLVCCVTNVFCKGLKKVHCALTDSKCTQAAIEPLYKILVSGRPDLGVPTSDPIHQDKVVAVLKDLNYTLNDAYLYGLKSCRVKKHVINYEQFSWIFDIQCPNLTLKSNYETVGVLDGHYVEGKGQCQVVYEKYKIGMRGKFDFVTAANGKSYFKIGEFNFHHLDAVKGVKYQLSNLYNGDKAKSQFMHKHLNDNWKSTTAFLQYPVMHSFMRKMFDHFNLYLIVVPADEVFYTTVST